MTLVWRMWFKMFKRILWQSHLIIISIVMHINPLYWHILNLPIHLMLSLPAIHLTSSHLLPSLFSPGDYQPPFIPLPPPPFVSVLSCILILSGPHLRIQTISGQEASAGHPHTNLRCTCDFLQHFWILSASVRAENAWLPMIIPSITQKRNRPENNVLQLMELNRFIKGLTKDFR